MADDAPAELSSGAPGAPEAQGRPGQPGKPGSGGSSGAAAPPLQATLELATAAFDDDPFYVWLFPRRRRGKVRSIMRFVLRQSCVRAVDGGFIAWTEPGMPPVRTSWSDLAMAMRVLTALGAWRRLGVALGIYRELARARPTGPHVYLELLAVDQAHRGQGLARTLIEGLIARADRHGWPVVLETTNPKNPPLYERFGFVTSLTLQRADAPPAWVMTRASPLPIEAPR